MTTLSSYSPQKENDPVSSNSPQASKKPIFTITNSPQACTKNVTGHLKQNRSVLSPKPATPNRKIKATLLTPKPGTTGSSPSTNRSPLTTRSPKRSPQSPHSSRSPWRQAPLSPISLSPLAWQTHYNARASPNAPATPAHRFVLDHPLKLAPTSQVPYDEFGFEVLATEQSSTPEKKTSSPVKRPQTPTQLRNEKSSDLWQQVLEEWDSWQDARLSNLIVLRVCQLPWTTSCQTSLATVLIDFFSKLLSNAKLL